MKYEYVISGIAGRFPQADNLDELADKLYAGIDFITDDNDRWPPGLFDLPRRRGKLGNLDKFDAGYFKYRDKFANNTDPQLRIMLELTFEALCDSGNYDILQIAYKL